MGVSSHIFTAGERGDAAEDDTRTTVSRKRRRQVNFVFTPAQERELAEWYRAYPLFYDKKNLFYKDVDKKKRIMQRKARTFDPPCSCKYRILFNN